MKYILWFIFGAAVVWFYLNFRKIRDIWQNRQTISAGSKLISGSTEAVEGVKDLIGEIDKS